MLPDDIGFMNLKEQEAEVKAIISRSLSYNIHRKKLEYHKKNVDDLTEKENGLQDEMRDKINALTGMKRLVEFQIDRVKNLPIGARAEAQEYVEIVQAEYNYKEMEIIKDK